jgi:hypothetical protein
MTEDSLKDGRTLVRQLDLLRADAEISAQAEEDLPVASADSVCSQVGVAPKMAQVCTRSYRLKPG